MKAKDPGLFLLIAGSAVSAATLIEKEKNGEDMTAVELTAIAMAEIRDCENRVPGFKAEASSSVARMRGNPKFTEIERAPEFKKLEGQAASFVQDRRRGADIVQQCKLVLRGLQNHK